MKNSIICILFFIVLFISMSGCDTRFRKSESGIIFDRNTKLEWFVGPNIRPDKIPEWISSLTIDGGGWRAPTFAEIDFLRVQEAKSGLDPIFGFDINDRVEVFVGKIRPRQRMDFYVFNTGEKALDFRIQGLKRVFAVRNWVKKN